MIAPEELPLKLPTRIITYAWGDKYVGELLAFTLPALMASGNLPYVASSVPCELIILTQERYFPLILANITVTAIKSHCPVHLVSLDDLISVPDKYGIALTHILHRGFADLGAEMINSWQIFLNADFVLADGSLRSLIHQLARGKRIIASPSYCVNAEDVIPQMRQAVDPRGVLTLSPREMASLVLQHRHNTIRAKTINRPLFSATYMDQFYWLADESTLLGRQMPIAIVGMRPERCVEEPNSYWDYGLMREFCPTAEFTVLGDSDDFLMLELRGRDVAADQLNIGLRGPQEIAAKMILFLTDYQRHFVRYPLVLHARDQPADLDDMQARLNDHVRSIMQYLPQVLPSHIEHPQWTYHRRGFVAGRHKHLSAILGARTEQGDPPANWSSFDKLWWRLDGAEKAAERLQRQQKRRLDAIEQGLLRLKKARSGLERKRRECQNEIEIQYDRSLAGIGNCAFEQTKAIRSPDRKASDVLVQTAETIKSCHSNNHPPAIIKKFDEGARSSEGNPWTAAITCYEEELLALEDHWQEIDSQVLATIGMLQRRHEQVSLVHSEVNTTVDQLRHEYDRILQKPALSAAIPQLQTSQGPIATRGPSGSVARQWLTRIYAVIFGRLPRVKQTHPYWAPLRHLVHLIDSAKARGAKNVITIVGASSFAESLANSLEGLHAWISTSELMQGNLAKSALPKFDLCVCNLDASELAQFSEVVRTIAPCMATGGQVIGFFPNLDVAPLPHLDFIRGLFGLGDRGQLYYAGSPASVAAIQRFRQAISAEGGRLATLIRLVAFCLFEARRSLAANRLEAQITETARPPTLCTSVTVVASLD